MKHASFGVSLYGTCWTPANELQQRADNQSPRILHRARKLLCPNASSTTEVYFSASTPAFLAAFFVALLTDSPVFFWCTMNRVSTIELAADHGRSSMADETHSTPPCPTRSQRGTGRQARRLALGHVSEGHASENGGFPTFFLNCLWIASSASLIVTPLRLRAVTSRPSGKCRSTFLTSGRQSGFFRTSLSSIVAGDVLNFLYAMSASPHHMMPPRSGRE